MKRSTAFRAVLGAAAALALSGSLMAAEFIVESRDGGKNFNRYSETGAWASSTAKSSAPGCTPGIGSRYSSLFTGRIAHFSFLCPATGEYQVFATWGSSTNGSDAMVFNVQSDAGWSPDILKDQNQNAGGNNTWDSPQNALGTYSMTAGNTYQVTLQYKGGATKGNRLMSDAVKWVGGPCADTPPVSVRVPLMAGDTVVRVTGVSTAPAATAVRVYSNGSLIGQNNAPGGAATVDVTVNPALAGGAAIVPTQVVNGQEGCTIGVPSWLVGSCEQIPAVSIDPTNILLANDTTVRVAGVDPQAAAVTVYANGVPIGANGAPGGASTVTVNVSALQAGAVISATQTIQSVGGSGANREGCVPAAGPEVGNCNQVPAVTVVGLVDVGRTSVRVSGVTAAATAVKVYSNDGVSDTLIGTNNSPTPGVAVVGVAALVEGRTIKAVQTIRIDGCMPANSAGRRIMAANMIEDFNGVITIDNSPSVVTGGQYRTWYDVSNVAYTDTLASTLFGSPCLNVSDHGWTNGAYAIYDQVIPADGTYHLVIDMLIDEHEPLDPDFYNQYQVGVVVNGAHRDPASILPAIASPLGIYPCLTPQRDGLDATEAQKVYVATFTAAAGDDLLIAFSTNVADYSRSKTAVPSNYVGMKIDNIQLVTGDKPILCTDVPAVGILPTVATPLEEGVTSVTVNGIDPNASLVKVFADEVQIGSASPGGVTEISVVVSPALKAGQTILATQTIGAVESCQCPGAVGPVVGTGKNSGLKIALGIRETGGSGPIGGDGGVSGNIEWVGSTAPVAGVPQGKSLPTDVAWQTVTFRWPGASGDPIPVDPVAGFTGDGIVTGAWGTIESLNFTIDSANSGRYVLYIDSIMNGGTLLTDFESPIAAGGLAMFREPTWSGSSTPHLLVYPDSSAVVTDQAAAGTQSYKVEWQFLDNNPKRWLRLTTFDDANFTDMPVQNPLIDLSQPVTMKILLYGLPPCGLVWADRDVDGDVDMEDFAMLQRCINTGGGAYAAECACFDRDFGGVIDEDDVALFVECASGPEVTADPCP